jgi:hypothetical protein
MTVATAHVTAIKRPNDKPPRARVYRTSLKDTLTDTDAREELLVDNIAADKCRVAAEGSRLSLACRVELIDYGRKGCNL